MRSKPLIQKWNQLRNIGHLGFETGPASRGLRMTDARRRNATNHGKIDTMKASIDSAGRIVVPRALRLALDLRPGQPLDIRAENGRLQIEPAATPVALQKRGKGLVAVPPEPLPKLTAEQVRDTLERIRR
jgi:AbrB family looped-hinge helix DNA binding protein